jgi:hypothetical protein
VACMLGVRQSVPLPRPVPARTQSGTYAMLRTVRRHFRPRWPLFRLIITYWCGAAAAAAGDTVPSQGGRGMRSTSLLQAPGILLGGRVHQASEASRHVYCACLQSSYPSLHPLRRQGRAAGLGPGMRTIRASVCKHLVLLGVPEVL